MAYIGVFVWSLMGAYLAVWFSPRIALPFLALTAMLFTVIPFKTVFFATFVFGVSYNSSFSNVFVINVGGFSLWFLEIFLFFVFVTMILEYITKRSRIEITPMFVLIGLFFLSTVAQTVRGYTLGYAACELRNSFRNALYPILILPISFYFNGDGTPKKFIKMLFVGWVFAIVIYLMLYFGIFFQSRQSLTGRLAWPPTQNMLFFFPALIVLFTSHKATPRETIFSFGLLLFSLVILVATQARSLMGSVAAELFLILPIIAFTRPKGKRLGFLLRLFGMIAAAVLLGILLMKLFQGERFDFFIGNVQDRIRSLIAWQKDVSIASRRYQAYESLNILKGNWLFGRGVGVEWHSLYIWGKSRIDNLYFMVIGHQGLVGMAIYLSIYVLWVQRSIALIRHHKLLEDPFERAFVMAQLPYIITTLVTGIAGTGAYLLPAHTIFIVSCAMITEYLYRGKILGRNHVPIVSPDVS
ncbi:O-antigen ligase family protein [bacterium]|nr:O-antigen ligase family protein [bacterium]